MALRLHVPFPFLPSWLHVLKLFVLLPLTRGLSVLAELLACPIQQSGFVIVVVTWQPLPSTSTKRPVAVIVRATLIGGSVCVGPFAAQIECSATYSDCFVSRPRVDPVHYINDIPCLL
jgi:hypothetical protein